MDNVFVFYSLIALLMATGIVVLFTVFNNRKNKLMQEQLASELSYQKKLHHLELKMLRDQMNPHFIHNSLNSIQYYIQRNEVEISENYLSKFSKLMRQFFEYSGRTFISIDEEVKLLKNYLFLEKLRFEDKFDYTIKIDSQFDTSENLIPPFMIQPLVENAINHGLFHKSGNGLITIEFSYISHNKFEVIITDNGVGLHKAMDIERVSKREKSRHSTELLQERMLLLRQIEHISIDFVISDLESLDLGEGTRATLTFNTASE